MSSGRYRRRKEQWSIERRGNCLAKAIQHKQETVLLWKQRTPGGGRLRLGEGEQYGSPTGQQAGESGGRGYGPFFSFLCAPTLQLCWAASRPSNSTPPCLLFTGRAPWLWYAAASPSTCGRRAASRGPGSSTASLGRTLLAGSRLGHPSCTPSLPGAPPLSMAEGQRKPWWCETLWMQLTDSTPPPNSRQRL